MAPDFLIASFKYKRRILLTFLTCLSISAALAFSAKKQYQADASFIILLGTEYTYRPSAGEQSFANSSLEREQILRTEVEILQNPDLRRDVLRKIGLERIYPDLMKPPGALAKALHDFESVVSVGMAAMGFNLPVEDVGSAGSPKESPSDLALIALNTHLSVETVRTGSTVNISFTHESSKIAAEVLNTLSALYLDLRRKLFSNRQSDLVEIQVRRLRQQLDVASLRLVAFKAMNKIANFQTRREILLREQGDVEKDMQEAASLLSQNVAKVTMLKAQVEKLPAEIQASRSAEVDTRSAPVRTAIGTLKARRSELATQYGPENPAMRAINEQIAAREAEFAVTQGNHTASGFNYAQNPVWVSITSDLIRARGELQAAIARLSQAKVQLGEVSGQLQDLGRVEQQLDELDRTRQVAEDNFRSASKVLEERQLVEDVEAGKPASVRLLQPAVISNQAKGTRRVILSAGLALSLLMAGIMALLSNYFRNFYLTVETLERDTGIAVLASIPETESAKLTLLVALLPEPMERTR